MDHKDDEGIAKNDNTTRIATNKIKNYIRKLVNKNHDLKDIILVILAIVFVLLTTRYYSLQKKFDAQETINAGLISENTELTTRLDNYYSSNAMEADGEADIDTIVEDNSESNAEFSVVEDKLSEVVDDDETKNNQGKSLENELSDIKKELEKAKAEDERLTEIYNELLDFVDSDYLGTDDYHSDQYIIFTDGEDKEITVTARSPRKYTTTVEGDNYGIVTEWVSPFENYQANLKFIPKDEGVTNFHFTNSFNSDSFDVLVVYFKSK